MNRKLEFTKTKFRIPLTVIAVCVLMITCKEEKIWVKKGQHLLNFRVTINPPLTTTPGISNYFWLDVNRTSGNAGSAFNFQWNGGDKPFGSYTGPGNLDSFQHPKKDRNQIDVESGDQVFFKTKFYASHYNNCHKIKVQVFSNDSLIKTYHGNCCSELSDNIIIR